MTLKAKGCFFRHNTSLSASHVVAVVVCFFLFPHLITFVCPFYGYWGAGRGPTGVGAGLEVSDLTAIAATSPNVYWKRASNNF